MQVYVATITGMLEVPTVCARLSRAFVRCGTMLSSLNHCTINPGTLGWALAGSAQKLCKRLYMNEF